MLATRRSTAAICMAPILFCAATKAEEAPDQVRMNDGTELRGIILQNTPDMLVLETKDGEARLPKEYIRRINDTTNGEKIFADIVDADELPCWRSIVHDMRYYDGIHSFEQIPPTAIDNGLLRNIPYLSFKVNHRSELNVYGDANNPVAVEFGVYGPTRSTEKQRRMFRQYMAGHLEKREQISALYSLSPKRQEAQGGKLRFRLILPDDPDGYGGTWIVVYRPDHIARARVGDREYAVMTKPFEHVNNPDGSIRSDREQENHHWLKALTDDLTRREPELRGFYRDPGGAFHALKDQS